MSDREEKRIKFCRYCDGVIEWGVAACPHCGESLELVDFEQMDFIEGGFGSSPPLPPRTAPPVLEPLDSGPPVLKPIDPPPPVVRPLPARPPVKKPLPVRPMGKKPPSKRPPVVKPLSPPPPAPPPKLDPLLDCPVCDAEMESASDVGGECAGCGGKICVVCFLRANGMRVSTSSERNRMWWDERLAQAGRDQVRCPACGRLGIR